MSGVYLDRARSGVGWLLDPDSPRLRELAREVSTRTPATPCDAHALAADVVPLDGAPTAVEVARKFDSFV